MLLGSVVSVVGMSVVVSDGVVVMCMGLVVLLLSVCVCVLIVCRLISECLIFLYSRNVWCVGVMCGLCWLNSV